MGAHVVGVELREPGFVTERTAETTRLQRRTKSVFRMIMNISVSSELNQPSLDLQNGQFK